MFSLSLSLSLKYVSQASVKCCLTMSDIFCALLLKVLWNGSQIAHPFFFWIPDPFFNFRIWLVVTNCQLKMQFSQLRMRSKMIICDNVAFTRAIVSRRQTSQNPCQISAAVSKRGGKWEKAKLDTNTYEQVCAHQKLSTVSLLDLAAGQVAQFSKKKITH